MKHNQQSNEVILEMVHAALQKWKWAEDRAGEGQEDLLKFRNRIRAEALKNIYLELLREARKRELSLSSAQLISRILYTDHEHSGT